MKPTNKIKYLYLIYALLGAIVGVFILYPLIMALMWFEFAPNNPTSPTLIEFMRVRFLFGFIPKIVHMELIFALLGGSIGLGFGFFTRTFLRQQKSLRYFIEQRKRSIPEIIRGGESDQVEFKSSIRWDVKEARLNRDLEKVIIKTIAGFFNSRGGDLLIGVADDGTILGLEDDYQTLKNKNADGFELYINDVIKNSLGGDLCPFLHFVFANIDNHDVCMITVEPSSRPVYLEESKDSIFFIRTGNSTRKLDVKEALSYARTRWKNAAR